MFWHFYQNPRQGEAYNAGGSRFSNCSMKEAITLCEQISDNKMNYQYVDTNRIDDYIWYISDVSKFKKHYQQWDFRYDLTTTLTQIHDSMLKRV